MEEVLSWSWGKLAGWLAFYELEPFGPLQGMLQAGTVAGASLAPWTAKGETPKPEDFFPALKDEAAEQEWESVEGQILIGKLYALAFGGE